MIPVKIVNWNKEQLTEEIAAINENKKAKNILKSIKDVIFKNFKGFLLKTVLPVAAALVAVIIAFLFVIPLIKNAVWFFGLKFFILFAFFMLVVYKASELISKTYITDLIVDTKTFQAAFHSKAFNGKVIEVETEPIKDPETGKKYNVPRYIGFENNDTGVKSYYSFASAPWNISESSDDTITLDVKNLTVYCPILN